MFTARHSIRLPLALLSAVLVLLIALIAAAGLVYLLRLRGAAAHAEAARALVEAGRTLVSHLAAQAAVQGMGDNAERWKEFSEHVRSVAAVEPGLQFVSVSKDGVTVYHEQARGLDGVRPGGLVASAGPRRVRLTRRVLKVGDRDVPVVVFATRLTDDRGRLTQVELALERDTITREERVAKRAVAAMFKVSMATVLVSFTVCMALVAWLTRREQRRETQRRQEEHLAFAGVLANGIVHDFRNPMSSVRLDAQLLEKEVGRGTACRFEKVGELASRLRGTVDRMDQVFREFLFISKPQSGEPETVDLVRCLAECLDVMRPRLDEAGIRVALDLPPGPVRVAGFDSSLRRALANVLTNAEQFSRRGDTIQVTVKAGPDRVTADVADQGPGVPGPLRERIFEMFFSTRPGGTGLGLFLARTALARCGGSLTVADAGGRGACFRMTLRPAAPGAGAPPAGDREGTDHAQTAPADR